MNYPATFEESSERRQEVQEAWKNFLAESGLPSSQLDLFPVLGTPQSLPTELVGQINVNKKNSKFGEIEAKEGLRGFIEQVGGVIYGDPKNGLLSVKDLSLISFDSGVNSYRAVYRQLNYPFPIANGFGELKLGADKNGKLLELSSRLIPLLALPTNPEVKPQEYVDRLIDREFTYVATSGPPQSFKATKKEDIVFKELVIYPKQQGNVIAIHLAYSFGINPSAFLVYIDAINGQELGVERRVGEWGSGGAGEWESGGRTELFHDILSHVFQKGIILPLSRSLALPLPFPAHCLITRCCFGTWNPPSPSVSQIARLTSAVTLPKYWGSQLADTSSTGPIAVKLAISTPGSG